MKKVRKRPGPKPRPLLQSEIEAALSSTRTNLEAARYLGVSFTTFRKYAVLYGIFDPHANKKGRQRGTGNITIKLRDILAGKNPNYDLRRLKQRLIATGLLKQECDYCGYNEVRHDTNIGPYSLYFKDGNKTNLKLDNLTLRCWNCLCITTGKLYGRFNKELAPNYTNPAVIKELGESPLGGKIINSDIEDLIDSKIMDKDDMPSAEDLFKEFADLDK